MKEWKTPYNSFNSMKGLLYSDWYQSIKDWKDGKRTAPRPPVEISLDPIHACNLKCDWCNASKYLEVENKMLRMPDDHLFGLIKFLGIWGAKAICFGGGGEPTLHSALPEALYMTRQEGMEASIATNGTLFNEELIEAMAKNCRWVGVSIDAASSEVYKIGRKADMFETAIKNLLALSEKVKELKTNCDVAYKFLIFDYNQHEIFEACKIAKTLGVKDFHVRPADWSHQGMGENKKLVNPYDIDKILKQFEKCHELEDENFHVYTIVHKFDSNFKPIKNFDQCYASPCCIQLCADGNAYLCPDQRHQEFYKLGEHFPNPSNILNFWGGERHYKLVFETGKSNCNTRCTFNPYCIQCQELFIKDKDPMCKWFI